MTETEEGKRTEPTDDRARPEWIDEAEEALERVGDSLRAAWDETRDSRMNALGSAKQAAKQLGDAIDRGVDAARSRWQGGEGGQAEPTEQAPEPSTPTGAGEEE